MFTREFGCASFLRALGCASALLVLSGGATMALAAPAPGGEVFPIVAEAAQDTMAAVAHDPNRQLFLVAWVTAGGDETAVAAGVASGGVVRARAVTEGGVALFPILELGAGVSPDVVYDAPADAFVVVWSARPERDIRAAVVAAGGSAGGESFLVSPSRDDEELSPAVACNQDEQRGDCLVVWTDGRDSVMAEEIRWGVWAQRIAAPGAGGPLIGTPFALADAGPGNAWNTEPDVAFSSTQGQYLVVYTRNPLASFLTPTDIHARRVTADGVALAEHAIDESADLQILPVVASFPSEAGAPYLVAYVDMSADPAGDVRARLVTADGLPDLVVPIANDPGRGEDTPALTGAAALGGFTAVWSEHMAGSTVWGRHIDPDGTLGPRLALSSAGGAGEAEQSDPAVDGAAALALVVWDDFGTWQTGTLDIGGRILGQRFTGRVFAGAVGDESTPLEGVAIALHCSETEDLGPPVAATTTGPEGDYGLGAPAGCPFYDIVETDPPGFASVGAQSGGGSVLDANRIRHAAPLEGRDLGGNRFWDSAATTPQPSPSATALDTPTPTAPPGATATPSPSPTSNGSAELRVNTTDDDSDGACDVTHCSLREAIDAANLNPGADTISFAIPAGDSGCSTSGVCTIRPDNALPALSDDATTIDAFSQSGASANTNPVGQPINATLKVVLDGAQLPSCCPVGIAVRGSDNTVRGLVVHGFQTGIEVLDGSRNHIEGCFIGTDASGTNAVPNRCDGIFLSRIGDTGNPSENTVGGTAPAARNLISGNSCGGVDIGPGERHRVLGNYIGVNSQGVAAIANDRDGVRVFSDSTQHQIGGASAGAANLIAFNGGSGVEIDGGFGSARRNSVRGNSIRANSGVAIRLVAGGNDGIAAPAIGSASLTRVAGSACAGCSVDVYSDSDDEAAVYEGATLADAAGAWTFEKTGGLAGPMVTAAATDALGNTSALSAAVALGGTPSPTPSESATATRTPTATGTRPTVGATATPTTAATIGTTTPTTEPTATTTGATPTPQGPTPTPGACSGDCDGDGRVSINELIRGVNIALARALLTTCPSFDRDGNGAVGIAELITAVNAALRGCAAIAGP